MLSNSDIRQNFTVEEVNLEKQKEANETLKSWKYETNIYANPGLR